MPGERCYTLLADAQGPLPVPPTWQFAPNCTSCLVLCGHGGKGLVSWKSGLLFLYLSAQCAGPLQPPRDPARGGGVVRQASGNPIPCCAWIRLWRPLARPSQAPSPSQPPVCCPLRGHAILTMSSLYVFFSSDYKISMCPLWEVWGAYKTTQRKIADSSRCRPDCRIWSVALSPCHSCLSFRRGCLGFVFWAVD